MSTGYLRVDKFIESVKHRAAVPMSQITFTDEDILRFANEDIAENMFPQVLAVREEFNVTKGTLLGQDFTTTYNNVKRIEVPYRAFGSKVRLLQPLAGNNLGLPLSPIPIERANQNVYVTPIAFNSGFYLENGFINVIDNNTDYVCSYYMRPSELVLLERAAKVVSIDRTTGIIEVDQVPGNIEALSLIDFNQTKPSHRIYNFDVTVQTVNAVTNQMMFTPSEIPDDLVAGDYICTAGECVIPQIPTDLHSTLAQATACKVLEAQGDIKNLKAAFDKLTKMEQKLLTTIDNRIEAPGRKLVNSTSLLYGSRFLNRKRW